MAVLILSFVAGVLTVAAPCILPLLPVIIGGSIIEAGTEKPQRQWLKPVIITVSLVLSVIAFSMLLKATTLLLGVPQVVWQIISGVIVMLFGAYYLWPHGYELASAYSGFNAKATVLLGKAGRKNTYLSAVLIGAALGPVFNSCSPTYSLIVAAILPASFIKGFIYLCAYAIGLGATLLLIAFLGQAFTAKLRWLSNPKGWFKRAVGVAFVVVGLLVVFGLDKKFQAFVLDQGWYDPITKIERRLEL